MTLKRALLFSLGLLGLVALGAVIWCGLAGSSAWAQGASAPSAPAAQPGAPPPGPPPGPPGGGGPEHPAPPLAPALEQAQSRDIATRLQGLGNLGQIYAMKAENGNPQVASLLRDAALHGETPELRKAGVIGVGGRAESNYDVILQASNDRDPDVQAATLLYLGSAPLNVPADARLEALTHAPQTEMALQAVDLLLKRYAKEGDAGIARLVAQMGNPDGDANAKAALQLINPVGRAAVPALISALSSSPNAMTRHGAAIVLAMLCIGKTARQQDFLQASMSDFKFDLKIADPDLRPLPVLMAHLAGDSDELVREACAEALGNIGSDQAVATLIHAVSADPVPAVRVEAAQALEFIPGNAALSALSEAVAHDPSPRVRQFAVTSLGWMHDKNAAPALILATQDKDPEVRRLAAVQLGRLGSPEALTSLIGLFNDGDEDVRWAAVLAVNALPAQEKARKSEAREALVHAAEDSSPLVAHAAEAGLQQLGETAREEAPFRSNTPATPATPVAPATPGQPAA